MKNKDQKVARSSGRSSHKGNNSYSNKSIPKLPKGTREGIPSPLIKAFGLDKSRKA